MSEEYIKAVKPEYRSRASLCSCGFLCLLIVLAFSVFALTTESHAVPANPDGFSMTQPDGNVINAKVKGDEWNNRVETSRGYSIKRDIDGYWYYISGYSGENAVFSSVRAHSNPPQGLNKHIVPGAEYMNPSGGETPSQGKDQSSSRGSVGPIVSGGVGADFASGTFNGDILFILAEFSDISGTYSEASFASFINNNINDYFNTASYGNVTLSPANESYGTANNGVVGWINMGYNHPNTGGSTGDANRQLTRDAIVAADPYVDYSAYDDNSDGYVDPDELAVVIIAAGYERSYSASYTPNLWGHKWSIGWGAVTSPVVDGVRVGDYHSGAGGYAQFGEIHRSSSTNQHQATMGIMVHELGHLIFGLPDLYDTDGSSNGIGAYGIMASGSWGKATTDPYSGQTPVLPSAWSKLDRGWIDAPTVSGAASIIAAGSGSATSANAAYKLNTNRANVYFLVENRQPEGYDRGLERWLGAGFGGLAIWQIDDNKSNNTAECYPPSDCTTSHYMVALEQADGNWDLEKDNNRGNVTDLWYSGNATTFDDLSTPDSDLYTGASTAVSVTGISASSSTMTATFAFYSFELSITTSGSGSGTVTSSPAGIDCGGDCSEDYAEGSSITLSAVPDTGSTFTGWSGDADCSDGFVTMDAAVSCTANFALQTYALNISNSGTGSGTVTSSPSGINCGGDCSESYNYNTAVTLTPSPAGDSAFAGWSGDADCSDGSVTMTAAVSCTATFNTVQYELTTVASPLSSGSITADCSGGCMYDSGTLVVLTATPNEGYNFIDWTNCDSPSNNICTETMNSDDTVTANFSGCEQPVRIVDSPAVYYATLQDAYDEAVNGDTIQLRDIVSSESLNANRNISVTIEGGYNCDYTSVSSETTFNGTLVISDGLVVAEDFVFGN